MKKLISIVMLSIIAFLPIASVWAGDSYWGSSSGNYTNSASWQTGGVPGIGDNSFFVNDETYTVDFTSSWTNDTASFEGATKLVTLDIGEGNTWNLTDQFRVGYDGAIGRAKIVSGTLDVFGDVSLGRSLNYAPGSTNNLLIVTNGAVVHSGKVDVGIIGDQDVDSDNLLHVTGEGSAWYVDRGVLNVGYRWGRGNTVKVSDQGYMAVRDAMMYVGSHVDVTYGTNNFLIIEDPGSLFELVAVTANRTFYANGNGRLIIRDGGSLVFRYEGEAIRNVYFDLFENFEMLIESGGSFSNMAVAMPTIRDNSRCEVSDGGIYSPGIVKIYDDGQLFATGSDSKFLVEKLYVYDNGYFEMNDGATNLCPYIFLGGGEDAAYAHMLMTGAGTYARPLLEISSSNDGLGRITVADQAYLKAMRFYLANVVGSTVIIEVTGPGSKLECEHSTYNYIGQKGICTLSVTNGAMLTSPDLTVGDEATAAGSELQLYDGTIVCSGTVTAKYGTVGIYGSGGTFAPGTLALTDSSSELAFVADDSGFTQIQPGTLTVGTGAKLTIDAQAWTVDQKVITNLVAYTSMPTPFDVADISVIVADGYSGSVVQGGTTDDFITLTLTAPPKGTVILVR